MNDKADEKCACGSDCQCVPAKPEVEVSEAKTIFCKCEIPDSHY